MFSTHRASFLTLKTEADLIFERQISKLSVYDALMQHNANPDLRASHTPTPRPALARARYAKPPTFEVKSKCSQRHGGQYNQYMVKNTINLITIWGHQCKTSKGHGHGPWPLWNLSLAAWQAVTNIFSLPYRERCSLDILDSCPNLL